MAFKLSKADIEKRDTLAGKLREKKEEIEVVQGTISQEVERLVGDDLLPKIAEYNELLAEARDFVETLASDMRGEYDDKSDGWRDGDRGQAADSFIQAFEEFSPDDASLQDIPDLTVEIGDDAEDLEALADAPE